MHPAVCLISSLGREFESSAIVPSSCILARSQEAVCISGDRSNGCNDVAQVGVVCVNFLKTES